MESLEREQNKSLTENEILSIISNKEMELKEALSKAQALKSQIANLQQEFFDKVNLSLNNERSCLNPVEFAHKNCKRCGFFRRCAYRGKEDYGRFKL